MKKLTIFLLLASLLAAAAPGASAGGEPPVRVWGLIGPTGMGLAPMISQDDGTCRFSLAAAPEELVGRIVSGDFDIAAVPTNLAAVLYRKTEGAVRMIALNTLGVLYILQKGEGVRTAADLSGRTLVTSGQGSIPEYALSYILRANGVEDLRVEYRSEHNEVSALAASGLADLVMLPQPMVTALLRKDPGFRVALDVTEAFAKAAALSGREGAELSMGCMVVREGFAGERPRALEAFMRRYRESVAFVNSFPGEAAADIVAAGILPTEEIAREAIPLSHIVYIDGEDMRTMAAPLFEILYEADPASVGGAVPNEAFYFIPGE